jgi:transposase
VPGPTPHYPPEFKREAVQLYRSSGKSIPKMAEELGIASESLRRWIKQHEVDAGEREGLTTEEREGLRRLRRENMVLSSKRKRSSEKRRPSLPGKTGPGELLPPHRCGEGELPGLCFVQGSGRFEELLLRLERQAALCKEPRRRRSHLRDPQDPSQELTDLRLALRGYTPS